MVEKEGHSTKSYVDQGMTSILYSTTSFISRTCQCMSKDFIATNRWEKKVGIGYEREKDFST
jgi:hypothetical protein